MERDKVENCDFFGEWGNRVYLLTLLLFRAESKEMTGERKV